MSDTYIGHLVRSGLNRDVRGPVIPLTIRHASRGGGPLLPIPPLQKKIRALTVRYPKIQKPPSWSRHLTVDWPIGITLSIIRFKILKFYLGRRDIELSELTRVDCVLFFFSKLEGPAVQSKASFFPPLFTNLGGPRVTKSRRWLVRTPVRNWSHFCSPPNLGLKWYCFFRLQRKFMSL